MSSVLIIAPHADDEVLGVGGTVSKLLSRDIPIHLIICGVRTSDSQDQITNATKNYTTVNILNYSDESYTAHFNQILKSIEHIYNEIKPTTVYIPSNRDFNQDHRCVHQICEIALRRYQSHAPEKILAYEVPSSTTQSFNNNFKCTYYEQLDISDVDNKINTMEKYINEMREYPNPRSREGLETYAKMRGMECGCEYAEGFELIYYKRIK